MFNKIFPKSIDNNYNGAKIALYAFYPMMAIILFRSCMHWFGADGGAQSIAGIPLDSYPQGAAQNIIAIFSLWGFSQFLMLLIYIPIGIRYKSLIPAFWLIQFIEWSGRWITGSVKPLELVGTAPGEIGNYIFMALSIIMLILSIKKQKEK